MLLDFWFTTMRPYWFGCPTFIDDLIKTNYETVLLETFANPPIKPSIELIILLDQVPRHIYRDNKDAIKPFDSLALQYAKQIKLEPLTEEQRCFALLPYRHTFEMPHLQYCLETIGIYHAANPHPMYKRFIQATLKAIAKINTFNMDLRYVYEDAFSHKILDMVSTWAGIIIMPANVEAICAEFRQYIDVYKPIVISVSGGVDSMVCLYIAHSLGVQMTAVSIDYGNRPEQTDEINMVNYVCTYIGIKHYVRRITEMQRPHQSQAVKNDCVDRDLYETFTRDIRFDVYKKIVDETGAQGVVLGHNQDDTIENIFSNIKKHKNYDNLLGMTVKSEERGVTILRPLLNVPKKDIVSLAHKYNIPYAYDSTPAWSERGQLRDKLIPAISEFDKSLLPGIIDLAKNYQQIYQVYRKSLPHITYKKDMCTFSMNQIYMYDYMKKILTQIALHYGVPFIKNKCIMHLLAHKTGNKVTLSKHMTCQISDDVCTVYIRLMPVLLREHQIGNS